MSPRRSLLVRWLRTIASRSSSASPAERPPESGGSTKVGFDRAAGLEPVGASRRRAVAVAAAVVAQQIVDDISGRLGRQHRQLRIETLNGVDDRFQFVSSASGQEVQCGLLGLPVILGRHLASLPAAPARPSRELNASAACRSSISRPSTTVAPRARAATRKSVGAEAYTASNTTCPAVTLSASRSGTLPSPAIPSEVALTTTRCRWTSSLRQVGQRQPRAAGAGDPRRDERREAFRRRGRAVHDRQRAPEAGEGEGGGARGPSGAEHQRRFAAQRIAGDGGEGSTDPFHVGVVAAEARRRPRRWCSPPRRGARRPRARRRTGSPRPCAGSSRWRREAEGRQAPDRGAHVGRAHRQRHVDVVEPQRRERRVVQARRERVRHGVADDADDVCGSADRGAPLRPAREAPGVLLHWPRDRGLLPAPAAQRHSPLAAAFALSTRNCS